jgi:hypothetical protein
LAKGCLAVINGHGGKQPKQRKGNGAQNNGKNKAQGLIL